MKPPRHSSDEGGIAKEKVVVQYNEENVLTSQPSSLAENGDDEYYLKNKNKQYKARKRKRSNRPRNHLDSIISEDDFNWLCQKENYGKKQKETKRTIN